VLRSPPVPATMAPVLEFACTNKILLLKASAIKIELSALIVILQGALRDEFEVPEFPLVFPKITWPTSNEAAKKRK
jgi:hypothetical protein